MRSATQKITLLGLLAVSLVITSANAGTPVGATGASANTLLYISPSDYDHSVRLLHPYYDYWFAQGPLVEPIALKALQKQAADISLCKANEKANTIVRIKPSLFYNPQMRIYHSRLVATVYSGSGENLGSYTGEAKQLGYTSVDNGTRMHISKAYALAMQDLMTKLPLDQLAAKVATTNPLPCGMVAAQTEPKVNFY